MLIRIFSRALLIATFAAGVLAHAERAPVLAQID
jgi:hypothetical protein